jgi:hypothetical protein
MQITCATCFYWRHDPTQQAVKAPSNGIIAPGGVVSEQRVGHCFGDPPALVLVPVQASNGGVAMVPQYPDRYTLESRPACHLHPGVSWLVRPVVDSSGDSTPQQ